MSEVGPAAGGPGGVGRWTEEASPGPAWRRMGLRVEQRMNATAPLPGARIEVAAHEHVLFAFLRVGEEQVTAWVEGRGWWEPSTPEHAEQLAHTLGSGLFEWWEIRRNRHRRR